MLAYALVVGEDGRRIPDEMRANLAEVRPRGLAPGPTEQLLWTNRPGTVALAGWQDREEAFGAGTRWHEDGSGITAIAGVPVLRRGGWRDDSPWATQLAGRLRARRLDEVLAGLLGTFTILTLDEEGRGTVASDPLGVNLIYLADRDGVSVLSNRADVAAQAAAPDKDPARDPFGACWLAFSPYPIAERTGYEQVTVVPAEVRAAIDPRSGLRFERAVAPPWEARNTAQGEISSAQLDEIHAEAAACIRAAGSFPVAEHRADLTGGKDSRLIVAVLLAEKMAESFQFHVSGRDDLPDVKVARRIASEFGLRCTVGRDPRRLAQRAARNEALRAGGFGQPERELVMRLNVGAWSGMRSVSEPVIAGSVDGSRVRLSGLCGECLRTNYPRTSRIQSMDELEGFLPAQLGFGQAGLILPEARAQYEDISQRVLLEGFGDDDAPQDAIDAFYVKTRIRRWFGTSQEADASGRVFPLYSPAGIAAAFAIGARERRAERLHFELIRRVSEPLARLPFEKDGWDAALQTAPKSPTMTRSSMAPAPERTGVRERRRPTLSESQPARTVGRDRRRRLESQDRDVMRKYLVDDRENPVFDVLDRPAVVEAVNRFPELSEPSKMQVYGALTAAIWVGGHEIDLASDRRHP